MHLRLATYKLRGSEAKFNYDIEGRDSARSIPAEHLHHEEINCIATIVIITLILVN